MFRFVDRAKKIGSDGVDDVFEFELVA